MTNLGRGDKFNQYYTKVLAVSHDHDLLRKEIFPPEQDDFPSPSMIEKQRLYCAAMTDAKVYSGDGEDNYTLIDMGSDELGLADLKILRRKRKLDKEMELNFNKNPSVISVQDRMIIPEQTHPDESQTRIFIPINNTVLLGIPIVNLSCERIYRYERTNDPPSDDVEVIDIVHGAVYDRMEEFSKKEPAYVENLFPIGDDVKDSKGMFLRLDPRFIGVSTTPSPFYTEEIASYHVPLELDPLQYVKHSDDLFLFVGRDQSGNGSCIFALNTSRAHNKSDIVWPAVWTKVMIGDSSTHIVLRDSETIDLYEWRAPVSSENESDDKTYVFTQRIVVSVSKGYDVGPLPLSRDFFDIELNELLIDVNNVLKEFSESSDNYNLEEDYETDSEYEGDDEDD